MFRETRSAVEATAIAYSITRDEKMLSVFLEDDDKPEQRAQARRTFMPREIFVETQPLSKLLHSHYDIASARSHTNMTNFVLHLAKSDDPQFTNLHTQDVQADRIESDLPLLLFWLCQVHLSILCCIDIIFPDLPSTPEMAKLKIERGYVFEKLGRFNQLHDRRLILMDMPIVP